jgi:hypothetical protein
VFTDLKLFNKSVAAGDTVNGKVILTKALSETKKLLYNITRMFLILSLQHAIILTLIKQSLSINLRDLIKAG